jgi:hypothetical protein
MKRILLTIILAIALALGAAACEEATTDDSGDGASDGGGAGAAAEWVEVVSMKGSANKRSESFELEGGEQRLTYTVKGSTMPIVGIYVEKAGWDMQEDGGFPVVMVDTEGKDSTMLSKGGGEYVIQVEAANCDWTVKLEERR